MESVITLIKGVGEVAITFIKDIGEVAKVMFMSDLWNGALIAIISAFAGSIFTHWRQRHEKNNDEKKQIESFLRAIRSEISSVWSIYFEGIGKTVEDIAENEGFSVCCPVFEKYFVIYDNNTNFIGNLDAELSEIIIKTYILCKSLQDAFLLNNNVIDELSRYGDLAQETKIEHYSLQYQNYLRSWQIYGNDIQKIHFQVKESKDNLIETINARLC